MSHGLENKTLVLRMGMRMFTPYIILELEGEKINPLPQQDDDYGEYFRSIHLSINQKAEFSYKNGFNLIYFRLKRKSLNQFATLGIVLSVAIAIGISGLYLPDGIRE